MGGAARKLQTCCELHCTIQSLQMASKTKLTMFRGSAEPSVKRESKRSADEKDWGKSTAAGAMVGAGAGALSGSVVPVIGTAMGAAAGALIGGGMGLAASIRGDPPAPPPPAPPPQPAKCICCFCCSPTDP